MKILLRFLADAISQEPFEIWSWYLVYSIQTIWKCADYFWAGAPNIARVIFLFMKCPLHFLTDDHMKMCWLTFGRSALKIARVIFLFMKILLRFLADTISQEPFEILSWYLVYSIQTIWKCADYFWAGAPNIARVIFLFMKSPLHFLADDHMKMCWLTFGRSALKIARIIFLFMKILLRFLADAIS